MCRPETLASSSWLKPWSQTWFHLCLECQLLNYYTAQRDCVCVCVCICVCLSVWSCSKVYRWMTHPTIMWLINHCSYCFPPFFWIFSFLQPFFFISVFLFFPFCSFWFFGVIINWLEFFLFVFFSHNRSFILMDHMSHSSAKLWPVVSLFVVSPSDKTPLLYFAAAQHYILQKAIKKLYLIK